MKRIKSLRRLTIALTGRASMTRRDLVRRLAEKGAHLASKSARATFDTDVLVRGESGQWKYENYGRKEAYASKLIRMGSRLSVILASDLDLLLSGRSVSEYPYVAGQSVETLRQEAEVIEGIPEAHRAGLKAPKGPFDRSVVVKARLEQAYLRHHHFADKSVGTCALCGRAFPTSLLRIGHIKRRSYCTRREKADLKNIAMPVCVLGCDDLYERGFVTVSSEGRVEATKRAFRSKPLSRILRQLSGRRCSEHRLSTESYFVWHRENAFMA